MFREIITELIKEISGNWIFVKKIRLAKITGGILELIHLMRKSQEKFQKASSEEFEENNMAGSLREHSRYKKGEFQSSVKF